MTINTMLTIIMYFWVSLASIYSAINLIRYWIKLGKASPIMIYVILLLVGITINMLFMLAVRLIWIAGGITYRELLLSSIWWPFQTLLLVISVSAIAAHLTYRMKTGKSGEFPFGIRPDGQFCIMWKKFKNLFKKKIDK